MLFSGSTLLETSRLQEKDHLTSLNSRLATYIDVSFNLESIHIWKYTFQKVRQLEQENNRLQVQIRDIEVVEKKEKSNLADRFEAEKVHFVYILIAKGVLWETDAVVLLFSPR